MSTLNSWGEKYLKKLLKCCIELSVIGVFISLVVTFGVFSINLFVLLGLVLLVSEINRIGKSLKGSSF